MGATVQAYLGHDLHEVRKLLNDWGRRAPLAELLQPAGVLRGLIAIYSMRVPKGAETRQGASLATEQNSSRQASPSRLNAAVRHGYVERLGIGFDARGDPREQTSCYARTTRVIRLTAEIPV